MSEVRPLRRIMGHQHSRHSLCSLACDVREFSPLHTPIMICFLTIGPKKHRGQSQTGTSRTMNQKEQLSLCKLTTPGILL
jgi:hypothetical protein